MDKAVYVCTGECKAEISQERYDAGLTACGADGCSMKGKPFAKMQKCTVCGEVYKEDSGHNH